MARLRSSSLVYGAIGAAGVVVLVQANEQPNNQPPHKDYLRNVYATADDCQKDYPTGGCGTETVEGKTDVVGPWYVADRTKVPLADPGPGVAARAGATPLAIAIRGEKRRGGFGATGIGTSSGS